MKPTEKQKEVAKVIKDQGSFWMSTNDINSPTHHCDIEECCSNLHKEVGGVLNTSEEELLTEKLSELYLFVKRLEE